MKVPPVGSSQMGWPGQVALGGGSWLLLSYKISKDDFTSKMGRTVYCINIRYDVLDKGYLLIYTDCIL